VSLDVDHLAMVEQAVEDGRGDDGIAEEFLPIAEALIGGDNDRASLVSVRDKLKEQIGFLGGYRQIAHLIDDDQRRAPVGFPLGLPLFFELADQGVHGRKIDFEAVMTGLDGQGDSQMGLPHPRGAKEDDVFLLGQKGQVEELHDGLLVKLRMEGKIVLLDGLGGRQPGDLHRRMNPSAFLGRHLFFQ